MKALACAGYDYMKIMVADLQKQLDDMEGKFVTVPTFHRVTIFFFFKCCLSRHIFARSLK